MWMPKRQLRSRSNLLILSSKRLRSKIRLRNLFSDLRNSPVDSKLENRAVGCGPHDMILPGS